MLAGGWDCQSVTFDLYKGNYLHKKGGAAGKPSESQKGVNRPQKQ